MLVQAWTLHKVLLGLGFTRPRVEEGVRIILNRAERADRDVETLLDEVLEWMALFCSPEEMPTFLETPSTSAPPVKKDNASPSGSGTNTPAPSKEPPAASARRRPAKPSGQTPKKPNITPASLTSDISNLELETIDTSDEDESSEDDSDSESELTPETLVPLYLRIQSRLYKLHPTAASVITGGKRIKGGGKKPTKSAPKPPPASLSDAKKQKVKRLQQKLVEFERDPLFDAYVADTAWRDQRAKLDEAAWMKKQLKNPPQPIVEPSVEPVESAVPVDDEDMGFMGRLFEGAATEEASSSGENIVIRDFEESSNSAESQFAKKAGRGKAGVGAAAMRKMVQEVCKSRDVNSKVRFDPVPGTSLSSRCRMTITWSSEPELEPTVIPSSEEDVPDILIRFPNEKTSVFEMKKLAAATREQAEGFTITYALFKLYGKKEEKLYLRLPTIWRNVWAEFVEIDRKKSEAEERKVLEQLKKLLDVENVVKTVSEDKITAQQDLVLNDIDEAVVEEEPGRKPKPSYQRYLEGDVLQQDWLRRRETSEFRRMEEGRQYLPMWGFRQHIIDTVEANPVVVLWEKQAFLMEHEIMNGRVPKIYCTQPRRISALSLARRVAEEMGEGKGRVGGLVGYAIRLENMILRWIKMPMLIANKGIVMRMLERSTSLDDITHLVLDEVHERSIESDFLLVVLKRLLVKRKDLKVILMSATVNAEAFSDYLGGAPILRVPGRTFPVQEFYLEDAVETTKYTAEDEKRNSKKRGNNWEDNDAEIDESASGNIAGNLQAYRPETRATLNKMDQYQIPYELIVQLLEKIATSPEFVDYSRAILIFLPGLGEIRRLNDMILGHPFFGSHGRYVSGGVGGGGWLVHMLHSTIASEDQEQAFLIPPEGMRKIVLSTNIAETGVTIPDVTAVIDTGKHKEMRFDEKRQLSRLVETFISKANAKQRRGRAGRDLVLRVKICGLGNVEEVLTSALDSPTPKNIRRAVDSLVEVKALSASEELTPLGRQLAKLPLDVYLGKLVLLGSIFSCLDATVTMAALLSSKSPFISPIGYQAEAASCRLSFKRGDSDLLTGWNAYSAWRRICTTKGLGINEGDFCRKNYLSSRTLSGIEDLKAQLFASLVDAGFLSLNSTERSALNRARYSSYRRTTFFIPPEHTNVNSSNDPIVSSAIAAAFYPKLLVREGGGWRNIVGAGKIVRVHPQSINKHADLDIEWLAYYGLMQSRGYGFDAQETSRVDAVVVALVCGEVEWRLWPGVQNIDGNRVRFSMADWRALMAVKMLRSRVRDIINRTWKTPEKELTPTQTAWMECFWEVFEGLNRMKKKD
ncbi:P-loop containing nucleoside triphosphate hydrolase protein [Geopyxis carbonaria]|nr:P-loop containing nucleoside triphosphate hydrolase protein [Geopyxis carbonaria]